MNPGLPPAESVTTPEKALRINVDAARFGTFAEIGAGQEVARWFFHVGRAAGTIAKAISAYDMAVSDELYGPTDRYVSRKRLQSMLTCEFDQLEKRCIQERTPDRAHCSFSPIPSQPALTRTAKVATVGWACVFKPGRGKRFRRSSFTSRCWIAKLSRNRKRSALLAST